MEKLKCLFGIDANTAATIIITIIVFVLGYIVNWVGNQIVELFKRRNHRKIFSDIIATLAKEFGKQSNMFLRSAASFNIENPVDYIAKKITITHLDNIDKLDFKDIYNAYFSGIENFCKGQKLKAFNKIWNNLSLTKGIEDKLDLRMEFFNGKLDEYQSKWDEHVGQLQQLLARIQAENNGQPAPNDVADYFEAMSKIVFGWQQLPNGMEHSVVRRRLIDRLLGHNIAHHDLRFQGNPMLEMNAILLNAAHDYDNLANTLRVYAEEFRHNYYLYRASQRVIEKAIKIL